MNENEARELAIRVLERRGYRVTRIGSGSGVPKNSRLLLEKNGERKNAVTKVSTGGRISFVRADDGSYPVLDANDFVVYSKTGANAARISLFNAGDVRRAFEENHASLDKRGRGHIPHWIAPDFEPGWRFVGSGFGKAALWTEEISVGAPLENGKDDEKRDGPSRPHSTDGLISRLKEMVATEVGVPISSVEIDLKIRL